MGPLLAGNRSTASDIYRQFDTRSLETVAVRSSAPFEDGADYSFAGMFDTELNVPREGLLAAILGVACSGRDGRPAGYAPDIALANPIPVLVQPMVEGFVGGVAFSCDPVSGDAGAVVEYSSNGPAAVTSGSGPIRRTLAGRQADGTYLLSHSDHAPGLARVLELTALLRNLFEEEVDVEWTADQVGLVTLLQVRPVFVPTVAPAQRKYDFQRPVEVRGTGVSAGSMAGPVRKTDMDSDPIEAKAKIRKGDIVLVQSLRLDQLGLLEDAGGLVLGDPSRLSHVAIRARETGIPAVGGLQSLIAQVPEGRIIEVDGTEGVVRFEHVQPEAFVGEPQPPDAFFDPSKMTAIERGSVSFVLSISEVAWVYCRAPLDPGYRKAVREVLDALGLADEREIQFDFRTVWPAENSPSIVYSQYVSWRTVNAAPRFRPVVEKAMLACDTLDVDAIRELSTGIIEMATDVFTECIRRVESVEAGAINDSQIAAMHMEEARLLFGELLGIVILDVLCARAVARVDTSKGAPLAFLEAVSEIKNHELSGRDSKDVVFKEYDIVDRFYRTASLRSLAEVYQW